MIDPSIVTDQNVTENCYKFQIQDLALKWKDEWLTP